MYHSFLIHSSAYGHLGYFHVLAIINSAVMNIRVHMSFSILISSVCMPSGGSFKLLVVLSIDNLLYKYSMAELKIVYNSQDMEATSMYISR